ncbi:hypothetical protein MF628_08765 [Paenibacillus polymyxa]|uniref:hypothetical protein n=1 Tax=Paenibacillus polymyxa TaxID=1406 RepID=UPI0020256077|nr:hypothetical protein [Paenibacillus polymyxa]WDZ63534.1 hypothetical protein MF628_08765 [Paenibacillus polymyxa]
MFDNEHEKKMQKRIYDKFIPAFLSNLLANELLDMDRLDDKEYINQVITENLHLIDDIKIHVIDYNAFIDGMKSEIDQSRLMTAVVLGGTCIEHIMNHFYQDALPLLFNLEQGEVNKAIGLLKLPDKVGWFYKITTEASLPEGLVHKILEIISLRNKIVHFQAIPELGDTKGGSHRKLNNIIESFDVPSIVITIKELEVELEKIKYDLWPEIEVANEIFERLFR